MRKTSSYNKGSKPTGSQAACGTTSCYCDTATGGEGKKIEKNNFSNLSIISKHFYFCK